jgi:hypothetical protein
MPKLEEPVKAFIVERLACFARPSEVVDAVKEEFHVTITRQHVEEYDPEKRCTTAKWVALHKATREAFLERKAGIAISHRPWRLLQLEEMARVARKNRNYRLAAQLLEQAAKEEGDFYVNARAGAAVGTETDEARVERIRAQLAAMDAATVPPPPTTGAPPGPTLVKKSA